MREDEIQTFQPSTSKNQQPQYIRPEVIKPELSAIKNALLNGARKENTAATEEPYYEGYHEFGYDSDVPFAPWRRRRYNFSIEGLHEEIIDLYHWIRPNELETRIRRKVYEKVYKVVAERWKDRNVTISMFGSLRTNLFLPSSDIDVLLECPDWDYDVPMSLPPAAAKSVREDICKHWLEQTAEALTTVNMVKQVSVFSGAFVPIVKMVDVDTSLSIDISFNTNQGVRAADYIEKVKQEFPIIEPLVLVLKQFLHYRRLNQTFTGGLSSYGLILLLVNFFQMYARPMRKRHIYDKGVNLGELLLRFFEVYSQEFNYESIGISVTQMRYIPKDGPIRKGVTSRTQSGTLFLEDPLLACNDVGRSTYNFSVIANSFGQALQILLVAITVRDRRRSVLWHKVYRGSLLYLIMPFTVSELKYRKWLMGGTLSFRQKQKLHNLSFVSNTLVSRTIDLTPFEWMRRAPVVKTSKALLISAPPEMEKIKPSKAESVTIAVPVKKVEKTVEPTEEIVEDEDDDMTPPPIITSTASVTTTVSTAASISERDDTDSPPLSSVVVTSSDDETAVNNKSNTNGAVQFKKPFNEVVAASGSAVSAISKKAYSDDKIDRSYNEKSFNGVTNGYAAAVNGNNKYRSHNYNRDKRSSRNHSQGSNDGSVNGSDYYNEQRYSNGYSNNGRGRGRASSHSSNRSRHSSDSRSTGYKNRNNFINGSTTSEENGNHKESQTITTATVNATINGANRNPVFRYADAVKMTNGNSPSRTSKTVTATVDTKVTNCNTNVKPEETPYRNVVNGVLHKKNNIIACDIIDDNKTSLNSPTINDINPQLLVAVNRR